MKRLITDRVDIQIGTDATSAISGIPLLGVATRILERAFQRRFPYLFSDYYVNANWDYIRSYYAKNQEFITFKLAYHPMELPQLLVCDNTLRKLPLSNFLVHRANNVFELDRSLMDRTNLPFQQYKKYQKLHRRRITNGLLLRLVDIADSDNGTTHIFTEGVRYENVCRTHLTLDARPRNSPVSLRERVHADHRLENLHNSRLANSLGINIIVFTADGKLVIPRRTRRVAVRPNTLSPSASGAVEFTDVNNLETLAKAELLREAFEELNIMTSNLDNAGIQLLGITRDLVHGGKPELFLSATSTLTEQDFCRLHGEATHSYEFATKSRGWIFWDFGLDLSRTPLRAEEQFQLYNRLEQLFQQHMEAMSLDLITNIALWIKSSTG